MSLEDALAAEGITTTSTEPDSTAVKRWSSDQTGAFQHSLVTSWLRELGVASGLAGDLANQLADDWKAGHGSWPTSANLINSPASQRTIDWYRNGFWTLPGLFGIRNAGGGVDWYANSPTRGITPLPIPLPSFLFKTFDRSEVNQLLAAATASFGTTTGGTTTGGGPRPFVLDKAPLVEAASQMWRGLLLEEAADVSGMVDSYISKATQFLAQGGQLDFESFMLEKIRNTGRHSIIYGKKPPEITEEAWVNQYLEVPRQLGIAPRNQAALAVSGAQYGASVPGFTERIQQSAEFINANQGSFSQRYAALVASMGIRGT